MSTAMLIMLLAQLLPSIQGLVHVAEAAFSGVPKSGAQKAALVNTAANSIVTGISSVATGGAAESTALIAPVIGAVVNSVASELYPSGTTTTPNTTIAVIGPSAAAIQAVIDMNKPAAGTVS